jgi:hypothetical protein
LYHSVLQVKAIHITEEAILHQVMVNIMPAVPTRIIKEDLIGMLLPIIDMEDINEIQSLFIESIAQKVNKGTLLYETNTDKTEQESESHRNKSNTQ